MAVSEVDGYKFITAMWRVCNGRGRWPKPTVLYFHPWPLVKTNGFILNWIQNHLFLNDTKWEFLTGIIPAPLPDLNSLEGPTLKKRH
jgi:hypothetical protein